MRHSSRILAFLCLIAIVGFRVDGQFLRLPFLDRKPIAEALRRYPDGMWQDYPRFLKGVHQHTPKGASIAIVAPAMKWDDGYSYIYYRASYFLAGREVLPLVTADDRLHPENFRAARYIAAWRSNVPQGVGVAVWSGDQGVLLRR